MMRTTSIRWETIMDQMPNSYRGLFFIVSMYMRLAGDKEGDELLGIFVEKWTCEIPRAITEEEDCVGDDLLGVACRIRNLHTQDHNESCVIRPCQVVADQAADRLICRHEAQTEGTGDVGEEEDEDEDAASVFEAVIEIDTCKDRDGN